MITYTQAEFLLDHYQSILAKAKNSTIELQKLIAYKLQNERGNLIEELSLKAYDLAKVIVQSNKIADVTAWVALNYDKMSMIMHREAERQIMNEVHVFGNIAEKVKNALKSLKVKEKTIIEMFYFEGLTYTQIGKKMKKTPAACRMIRHRAIEKLQRLVDLDKREIDYLMKIGQEGTR